MTIIPFSLSGLIVGRCLGRLFATIILAVIAPFNIFSNTFTYAPADSSTIVPSHRARKPVIPHRATSAVPEAFPDSIQLSFPADSNPVLEGDSIFVSPNDSTVAVIPEGFIPIDTCTTCGSDIDPDYIIRDFNPDPTRAAWLSALFPGLGQLYNRRYWKLPLVAGGFMGLLYGYSWNNRMFEDYTQGYRDLMDNDPLTNSYMDFYPPGTNESTLNREWLQRLFKSRKDYYRRNRDFCVLGMVGVYLVAIVDAYVDASLTHFDISPDISLDMAPTIIPDARASHPGFGLVWALNF
ncbi:MAG: hypothetical protein K2M98_08655 [Muribaculum sp.]|nr:hypothetical protein [Muribaculum sp.]